MRVGDDREVLASHRWMQIAHRGARTHPVVLSCLIATEALLPGAIEVGVLPSPASFAASMNAVASGFIERLSRTGSGPPAPW